MSPVRESMSDVEVQSCLWQDSSTAVPLAAVMSLLLDASARRIAEEDDDAR